MLAKMLFLRAAQGQPRLSETIYKSWADRNQYRLLHQITKTSILLTKALENHFLRVSIRGFKRI